MIHLQVTGRCDNPTPSSGGCRFGRPQYLGCGTHRLWRFLEASARLEAPMERSKQSQDWEIVHEHSPSQVQNRSARVTLFDVHVELAKEVHNDASMRLPMSK